MKRLILYVFVLLLSIPSHAQDVTYEATVFNPFACTLRAEEKVRIQETAKEWFENLCIGKSINKTMKVSDVPFSIEGKDAILTKKKLRQAYNKIIKDTGSHVFPSYYTDITECDCMTNNPDGKHEKTLVRIQIINNAKYKNGESIAVIVSKKGNVYKVVGFYD